MYNSNNLANRIKNRAKEKNIFLGTMLNDCGLGINALSQSANKKGLSSFSLARIADYLDCSVDYLLGRTDIPEVNRPAPQLHKLKIAARGGGIKELTVTDDQLQELLNLPEVTSLDDFS